MSKSYELDAVNHERKEMAVCKKKGPLEGDTIRKEIARHVNSKNAGLNKYTRSPKKAQYKIDMETFATMLNR